MTEQDPCKCGHDLVRHDMGHGCIECRCRGFRAVPCEDRHEWIEIGGPGDEWRECDRCGKQDDQ